MVMRAAIVVFLSGLGCARATDPPPPADQAWAQHTLDVVNTQPTPEQQALADQAKRLGTAALADPQMQQIARKAQEITRTALQQQAGAGAQPIPVHATRGEVMRVFISQSLPDATVQSIMDMARKDKDMVVEVRGFRADQTLGAMISWLRRFMVGTVPFQQAPDVEIDPLRFSQLAVTRVPAVAMYRGDKPVAWARGSFAARSLRDKVQTGSTGDLGTWGQTYPVLEEDLGARLQRNFDKIDFAALKKKAASDFWKNYAYVDLPAAKHESITPFDPSFIVNQDIRLPDGRYLARKGDRVNPLDRLPFTQAIIVFDATSQAQVQTVKTLVRELGRGRHLNLMVTRVAQGDPMHQLQSLGAELGWPVYLLNAAGQASFHIQTVPSLVVATHEKFLVHAFVPGSEPKLTEDEEHEHVDSHAPPG